MAKQKHAISPTREENYAEWYQQIIKTADLAENASVHGCMIIKPWGYALWENIQKILDQKIKLTGHENVYFPLFIPLSYLQKEADHVEGFAKECAVVTHHRLEKNKEGQLVPASPLEEPLVVRPTSEMIIGEAFSRWIQSYRDLPLLTNQWANIVRWEMRTRLFLRTTEFLWQEGHTAHATENEALDETLKMLNVYSDFASQILAMPVIEGLKTECDKFPGAVATYCIETMMQDKKALQAGTSHFLGQNFSKAMDIKYLGANGQLEYTWTTSWGVSTRLIGGLIMTHSDDDGLVLPPRIAPIHVIILPVIHESAHESAILDYCDLLTKEINALPYHNHPLIAKVDTKDERPGDKAWGWYKKGVPIRIEIGPREIESQAVFMGRRDHPYNQRANLSRDEFIKTLTTQLDEIQNSLLNRAIDFRNNHSEQINSKKDFYDYFNDENKSGFAYAYYHQDKNIEEQIKKELSVTARCIPLATFDQEGTCIFSGKKDAKLTLFAKAY